MENASNALPLPWQELRKAVEVDSRVLSEDAFGRARQIFIHHYTTSGLTPENLTEEYTREEFLLVVDKQGEPSGTAASVLESYEKTSAIYPQFKKWFQEAILPDGLLPTRPLPGGLWAGRARVLLASRWLCHLIGLRHGTVEIFIDPPHLEGHTLIQVRGLDKFEAPGAFDIPCAGHISGVDTAEATLRKELAEELNLTMEDLCDLRLLQRYNSYTGVGTGTGTVVKQSVNNEYRILYRARLKSTAAENIRFTDGEVVGLAVFSVPGLKAMVDRYPERIASGLGDAIGFYM